MTVATVKVIARGPQGPQGNTGSATLAGLTDVTGTPGAGKAPVGDGAGHYALTDIATQAELDAETIARIAAVSAAIATAEGYTNTAVTAEATARTAAISAAVTSLVNAAPSALDTLKELADALGDDANFATTVTTALAGKLDSSHATSSAPHSSTGDLTFAADSDASGAGDLIFKTATVERLRITSAGRITTGTLSAPLQFTGVPYFGNSDRAGNGDLVVMDDTNNTAGVIQWENNATNSGEMIHLTGGPNNTGSGGAGPNLIALGLNYGGVGLFINNYRTGVGLKITNRSTITNASAWGFLLSQNSTLSEGMYLSQETSTALMPLKIVSAPIGSVGGSGAATGQILTEWRRSQSATADTLLARVAVDGALFQVPVTISSQTLTVTGAVTANSLVAQASGANIEMYDTGGTANQRRWKWSQSAGILILSQRLDNDNSNGDLLYFTQSKNMGLAGFNSFGGGIGGVVGLPNVTTIPTSDPVGGGFFFVSGGALFYRGSAGTVTAVAAA